MKAKNPRFWTRVNNQLQYRDLEQEEGQIRYAAFQSFLAGVIDEPVMIYYEVFDNHSSGYIDDSLYQRDDCFIKPNDIVLDLGANIGIFSRFANEKGAAKIYSFEPTLENFQLLMLNRPDNCEAHRIAVCDQDGVALQIAYKEAAPGGSSIIHTEGGVLQTCMGMTVSTMIDNGVIQQPDFIKMDIEGAEVHAFRGIRDEHLQATRSLVMELHLHVINKQDAEEIYLRMTRLGFKHFTLFNPDQCNIVWFTNTNLN